MDSESIVFRRISALIIGAAAGVGMAMLLLLLFQATAFHMDNGSFFLIAAAAAALPLCLDRLRRRQIEPELAEPVMILLSALICAGYAHVSAGNEITRSQMLKTVLTVHGISLAVYCGQWIIHFISLRKQDRA